MTAAARVQRQALIEALGLAAAVAGRRTTMPILADVLVTFSPPETVTLRSTDLIADLSTSIGAEVEGAGKAAVPVVLAARVAKAMPGEELELEIGDRALAFRSGRATARVEGHQPSAFPNAGPTVAVTGSCDAAPLVELLRVVDRVAPRDVLLPNMSCARITIEGDTWTAVATDGERLHVVRRVLGTGSESIQVIVPAAGLVPMLAIAEAAADREARVEYGWSPRGLAIRADATSLWVSPSDAKFPPVERVFPARFETRVTVSRKALDTALARAQGCSSRTVRLELGETLGVASEEGELSTMAEEIVAESACGPRASVALNPGYVRDFLEVVSDEVVSLSVNGPLDPVELAAAVSRAEAIVMPVRT